MSRLLANASIYHKTRKPTKETKVKRKIYVGMDIRKETITDPYKIEYR
ncbi:hypothetical protein LEP1GSC036_0353 [Leptospira weilii str. 2006001853]|uniref:Uncharacterized protein n=2 Tax=Leptospira weilii TaxID=28184 RepID=A0A828Z1X1_9LEPT|nr:hypothetical protein LEP1GSC036_0353 [Leptospira weilii str. 2006001853]EMM73421.1 hypothetical protein LEP1GSC038_2670 [Leptospira weilii str. 2006001855]EMN44169.1 hypothetical protein LEP1GSC086_0799 [Leptospira weilii str. LNT 1234]